MPTNLPRIQVTVDAELAEALVAAAPHLPGGLSRGAQVRALALAGARGLTGPSEPERLERLRRQAADYDDPDAMGIDWDLLRDVKTRAWREW